MKLRNGARRLILAAGSLVAVGALLTVATTTDTADHSVTFDGSRNVFDLMVSGSSDPGWEPRPSDWEQGNPEAYELKLDDSAGLLAPDGELRVRIAAKNASPRLAGMVNLTILDPQPLGTQKNPASGTYLELFDQLVFTVREGNTVIFDRLPATALTTHSWDRALAGGDYLLLDVLVELPESVGNRYQGASTTIQFHFEAETA